MTKFFTFIKKRIVPICVIVLVISGALWFWHYRTAVAPVNPAPVFENNDWGVSFVYAPWFSDFNLTTDNQWQSCAYGDVCIRLGLGPVDKFEQYFDEVSAGQSQGDPDNRIIDIPIGKRAYLDSVMSAEGIFTARVVVLWSDTNVLDIEISGPTAGIENEAGFYEQLYAIRQMILNNLQEI